MEFTVIIEKGEDGYLIAEVPELPGCHTQARRMEELIVRIKEAISLYLKEEKAGWLIVAEKSMQKIWDNKKDDEIWINYLGYI